MWFVKLLLIFIPISLFSNVRYEVPARQDIVLKSLELANNQVGTLERGNNRGEVEKYWRLFASYPIPYCAAGLYWNYWTACRMLGYNLDSIPFPKTALALGYLNVRFSIFIFLNSQVYELRK